MSGREMDGKWKKHDDVGCKYVQVMYTSTHTHMHARTHAHTHRHTHTRMHTDTHTVTHMINHTGTQTRDSHMQVHAYVLSTPTSMFLHIVQCTYRAQDIYTHTYPTSNPLRLLHKPTSVHSSQKLLPQHVVLLARVSEGPAQRCEFSVGEGGLSYGGESLSETRAADGAGAKRVKVLEVL